MSIKATYTFIIPIGKKRYALTNVNLSNIWQEYFNKNKVTSSKTVTPLENAHRVVLETVWSNEADFNEFKARISSHTDAMNEYNEINNIQVTRVIEKL